MASTVMCRPALRRAVATVALPPAHRHSLLHSSTQGHQRPLRAIDEFDSLCKVVGAIKVSSLRKDILPRLVESSFEASAEFVQEDIRRTWMVSAVTLSGFFAGCLLRARKMNKEAEIQIDRVDA